MRWGPHIPSSGFFFLFAKDIKERKITSKYIVLALRPKKEILSWKKIGKEKVYVVSDSFHESRTTKEGNKSVSHTLLHPASLSQKAQMLDLAAISLPLWPENQQKPRKLFVLILLSAHYNEGSRSFISFLAHPFALPLSKDVSILKGQKQPKIYT